MEIRALLSAMTRSKAGPLLVALQVALALAVLVNLAFVIEQRLADASRPSGLDLDNMFWVTTQALAPDYDYATAVRADLAYLNSLPGVVAATPVNALPQTFAFFTLPLAATPQPAGVRGTGVQTMLYMGTDRFIDAMGLTLVAGRDFRPDTVRGPARDLSAAIQGWAPEMIVTRALASKLFPAGGALGKTVYAGFTGAPAVIVGIVDLMRPNPVPALRDASAIRVAILPIIPPGPNAAYVIRAQPGRRDELMARVEKEFARLQPGRFISRIQAYNVTAAEARQAYRASAIILGAVAVVVLLVTVVGIVGLAAFNVATRTKQLGIRRAVGARRFHILRYFLIENWIIMTCGVALGCILALAAGVQVSRVYQLERLPLYFLAAGVLTMWVVGLLAVLVPALRAASVSPAVATRTV